MSSPTHRCTPPSLPPSKQTWVVKISLSQLSLLCFDIINLLINHPFLYCISFFSWTSKCQCLFKKRAYRWESWALVSPGWRNRSLDDAQPLEIGPWPGPFLRWGVYDEKPQNPCSMQSLLEGRNKFILKTLWVFSSYSTLARTEIIESPRASHWQLGREKPYICLFWVLHFRHLEWNYNNKSSCWSMSLHLRDGAVV